MAFRRAMHQQLPIWRPWSFERVFGLVSGAAGVISIIITSYSLAISELSAGQWAGILIAQLTILSTALIVFIYIQSRKKLHRYAQSTIFIHFINHITRDQITRIGAGQAQDFNEWLQDVLDATSSCFSIITAQRCRCSIKELTKEHNLRTVVRDTVTRGQFPEDDSKPHKLSDNTDFEDLWYGKNGSVRFFACRNLVKLWKSGKYKNSSFETRGYPEVFQLGPVNHVYWWTLPYKSTIVVPIRYVPEESNWPPLTRRQDAGSDTKPPFWWGFLCLDWKSQNIFDPVYAPELAAAIADSIFTVFHAVQLKLGDDSATYLTTEKPDALPAPAGRQTSGTNVAPSRFD